MNDCCTTIIFLYIFSSNDLLIGLLPRMSDCKVIRAKSYTKSLSEKCQTNIALGDLLNWLAIALQSYIFCVMTSYSVWKEIPSKLINRLKEIRTKVLFVCLFTYYIFEWKRNSYAKNRFSLLHLICQKKNVNQFPKRRPFEFQPFCHTLNANRQTQTQVIYTRYWHSVFDWKFFLLRSIERWERKF